MGASVFEIPKLLEELDPELIETHQSIYATHAAAAHRHIEHARWLGESLYQKHWAGELEEELIPQLPWPDDKLAVYTARPDGPEDLEWLSKSSPIMRIRDLAHLVRIRQGDFSDLKECSRLHASSDPAIAAEAALQFSGWRSIYCTYTEISRYELIGVLQKSPLPRHAAPRLAVLGADPAPEYQETGDPDTDFLVLILDQNIAGLEGMLNSPDPMRQFVAAAQLIRHKCSERIGPALRRADGPQQLQLLQDIIRYKTAVPHLHEEIFDIYRETQHSQVRKAAGQVISMAKNHADSMRLFELSNAEGDVLHSLLRSHASSETYAELGARLVQRSKVNMAQWGWDEAAKPGCMPIGFVESNYGLADNATRAELLKFAEKQIEAHGETRSALERFLIRQCFAEAPVEVIGTAWACIHRIQMHRRVGLTVPCDLSLENVEWCWNMREVLNAIAGLMENPEAVRQTFVRDDFDRFLRSAGQDFFAAAREFPDECERIKSAAPKADPYIFAVRFAAAI